MTFEVHRHKHHLNGLLKVNPYTYDWSYFFISLQINSAIFTMFFGAFRRL